MTGGHTLRLYNSLGRVGEEFVPGGGTVGMYSCGPTVYSYPHIGNMRAYVFADTLRRALRWKGLPVRHVVNITDVGHAVAETELGEDKLEVAAARERRGVEEIAEHYTAAFFADLASLNVLPADEYPRATAYVPEMIDFAVDLQRKGFAYEIGSGLYFDTTKSDGYGELGLIDVAGQREGARVEEVPGRRTKSDFALWRSEAPGRRRTMRWSSPWGWGAPGWHLECSVMSMRLLGEHFDIHTGGIDHRELHHVNEIAQSEAFLGDGRWVRYWLHNEFVRINAEKVAKSQGRAPRLSDLGAPATAYRLFLLGGHYRSPIDFTFEALGQATATLRRLAARVEALGPLPPVTDLGAALSLAAGDERAATVLDQIDAAISADLNTPQVLAVLQDSFREPGLTDAGRRAIVAAADSLLGLGLDTPLTGGTLAPAEVAEVERLVAARTQARADRAWADADAIRQQLHDLGVAVADTPQGPVWSLPLPAPGPS